jgi:hypothetical protein
MVDKSGTRLRLLAAEMRGELQRIDTTVGEIQAARSEVERAESSRLSLYGAAALLETFYSGVEKVLSRVAAVMGGLPEGPSWHRRLLESSTLDLPRTRPPVLAQDTAKHLEPYLAFRHRFRNLYLFDLEKALIMPLLAGASPAWEACSRDLVVFCEQLDLIADRLDE